MAIEADSRREQDTKAPDSMPPGDLRAVDFPARASRILSSELPEFSAHCFRTFSETEMGRKAPLFQFINKGFTYDGGLVPGPKSVHFW